MKKQLIVVVGVIIGVLTSVSANAEGSKYSVFGEFGNATYTNMSPFPNPSSTAIGVGYQVNQNIAAELQYVKFGDSIIEIGGGAFSLQSRAIVFSAVGVYPLGDSLAVFGSVGVSSNKSDVVVNYCLPPSICAGYSFSRTSLAYGIGGLYKIDEKLDVRLRWQNFGGVGNTASSSEFRAISFGAAYHF